MKMNSLKVLITEAVIVDRNLHRLAHRLRRIKHQIVRAAADSPHRHQPTCGGGSSWIAEGFDGCVARVSFPADALLPIIDPETPAGQGLLLRLGQRQLELLRPVLYYEPLPDYRERVRNLFDPRQSEQIIAASETPSPARVSFATKPGPKLCPIDRAESSRAERLPKTYETNA